MSGRREFVALTVDLPGHPKLAGAPPATRWLHAVSVMYAGRNLTDDHAHAKTVVSEAGVTRRALADLIARGSLHEQGHDCPKCPEPADGWVYVHDYLEANRTAAQAEAQRRAGRKGAEARWNADRNANRIGEANAQSQSQLQVVGVKVPSRLSLADATPVDNQGDDLDLSRIKNYLGCDDNHAAKTALEIIGRSKELVRDPTAYVLNALGKEPVRYKPTPTPPRYVRRGETA